MREEVEAEEAEGEGEEGEGRSVAGSSVVAYRSNALIEAGLFPLLDQASLEGWVKLGPRL